MVAANASARGSFGGVSNRNDATSRDEARTVGTPIARPMAASTQTSRSTIQTTFAASGAKGHAQADLARAARHRIRHRGVEADAGDHQGEYREGRAQSGEHDLLIDGLVDVGGLRLEIGHRHTGVGLVHDLADDAGVAQWIAVGAQRVGHLSQ